MKTSCAFLYLRQSDHDRMAADIERFLATPGNTIDVLRNGDMAATRPTTQLTKHHARRRPHDDTAADE